MSDHQSFLTKHVNIGKDFMTLLNWNVQNPSIHRAYKQSEFILKNGFDMLVLTEIKNSPGCMHLKDRLIDAGYHIYLPKFKSGYGVMIATKDNIEIIKKDSYLAERLPMIKTYGMTLIGIYVPPALSKDKRRRFLESYKKIISGHKTSVIIAGDLNVPYPDDYLPKHKSLTASVYNAFGEFIDAYKLLNKDASKREFSLYRKKGYRPDNIFVTKDIEAKKCYFIDTEKFPRNFSCKKSRAFLCTKLSDHRPMVLEIQN